MNATYPINLFRSKLFYRHINRTIETAFMIAMLPKMMYDVYVATFREVYQQVK